MKDTLKNQKGINTMKQMVYVVLDNGEVLGVYDKYTEAESVATETATITPVIVGQTDDCRIGCDNPSEVIEAMEYELQNIGQQYDDDDDDDDEYDPFYDEEDEDEDDDEDEDEDEDEDDKDAIISLMLGMMFGLYE